MRAREREIGGEEEEYGDREGNNHTLKQSYWLGWGEGM